MNVVAQVFAGLAALVHIVVFVWETFLFRRPGVHQGIFRIPSENVPAVLLWSFNQGFYNLFLASGTVAGLVALHTGNEAVGRALVLYTCAFMALAGVVLGISDLMGLGRAKGSGWGGAVSQISAPLVVLVAAAVS
ncbi:MAG: putative rane protein [Actinomycetota bacterium]|nr:putative rane protein [Actinomycetota bacterium]